MSEKAKTSPKGEGFPLKVRGPRDFSVGQIVSVAFILISIWIFVPGTLRLLLMFMTLLGAFIVPRGPRDFFGGLALMALAIVAIVATSELPGQHGFAFGPGTAPRMFATLLVAIGAIVAVTGLFIDGEPIGHFAVRGPAYVLVGILVFAGMIRGLDLRVIAISLNMPSLGIDLHIVPLPFVIPSLGLVVSTFFAFMISILGSSEFRWLESLIAASVMTGFCVGLFVYLLQLPFQLMPWFWYLL